MTPTTDAPPRTPVRYLDLLARAKAYIAGRSGQAAPHWQRLFDRRNASFAADPSGDSMLKPQLIDSPALAVLTATGRGMARGDMSRAAQQAFGELMPALDAAGLLRLARCAAVRAVRQQPRDHATGAVAHGHPHCIAVNGRTDHSRARAAHWILRLELQTQEAANDASCNT
jgi:hypothetical protein